MTENATATDRPGGESEPLAARVRELLRRYNPLYLAPLGFLSVPAEFVDQLVLLEVFGVFYVFFLWIFVGPLVDLALRTQIEEESEPTDWIEMGGWSEMVVALASLPLAFLNPLVLVQDLMQFVCGWVAGLIRYRGSLPDVESYEQAVDYRLPVDGEWTVVNGSPEREYSHSWIYPTQRYAYDLVITDEDDRTRPEGASAGVEEYYCYDEPVVAPADGVVVKAFDAALETTRAGGFSHPASRDIRGGYVVIKHADAEYSLLAHLKPGSVPVAVGQQVSRGQEVGRCGHTGNSSEPHLHFQIQDHPTFTLATSLPVQFDSVETEQPGVSHDEDLVPGVKIEDGVHERSYIVKGQRVAHAGTVAEEGAASTRQTGIEQTEPSRGAPAARWLKHGAFGLCVGAPLLFVARLFLSGWPLVGALAGAGLAGLLFGLGYRARHGGRATRSGARPLGIAAGGGCLAVLTSIGIGSGGVVGILLLAGLVGYAATAELERYRFSGWATSSAS